LQQQREQHAITPAQRMRRSSYGARRNRVILLISAEMKANLRGASLLRLTVAKQ